MESNKQGSSDSFWARIRRPSTKYSVLTLAAVFFGIGMLFLGGFNAAMDVVGTLEFCGTTCHEMRDTVYKEYMQNIHYKNRTGVRAICTDCHVPRPWFQKVWRKGTAGLDVLVGKATGVVDTPEKFEAKRMEMASIEWKRMTASRSIECRACHDFDAMDPKRQKPAARQKHDAARQEGKHCIECHKGIAHKLPKEYKGDSEEEE